MDITDTMLILIAATIFAALFGIWLVAASNPIIYAIEPSRALTTCTQPLDTMSTYSWAGQ